MSVDRPAEQDPDTLDRARRIHAICESHEAEWRAGLRPRIEDQLARAPNQDRAELLSELIALVVELRRSGGERPTPGEYLARFPGHRAAIAAAFDESPVTGLGDGTRTHHPRRPFDRDGQGTTVLSPSGARSSPPGALDADSDLGDFELLEEIARGGMGIVYKARKKSLNCLVALKVMQAGPLATEAEKQRFLLEAEAAANLDHPNIVPVYEIDRDRGRFFTMKWVEGGSLARQIKGFLDEPLAIGRLLAAVARAIDEAHRRGYLHRDLKPANILLDAQGKPYVTDFGLARRMGEDSGLTQSGAVVGTPSYMAPEQAGGYGGPLGPAADVYSLGAVLYELLTGRPPFRAGTVMETLVLVLERDPTPPGQVRPGVPAELEAICLKCLEKNPQDRYPSARALADDLDRFLRGGDVQALHAGPRLRLRRWTRREPELVARLIGLGAVEVLAQVNYIDSRDRHPLLHIQVTATLAAWMIVCLALQAVARRERWVAAVRPAWVAADVGFLTLAIWLLGGVGSSLAVGYPLVVAASGLWFRVGLIWLAIALAEAGYGLLVLDAWLRGDLWSHDHHPNIVMAVIAVAGFVVARQVMRLLVLSSYYENRLPGD
jgi:serine/threonine-protein kinase